MASDTTKQTEAVLNFRLEAVVKRDLEDIMRDVDQDVVLFRPDGPLIGYDKYRNWYVGAVKNAPSDMADQFEVLRKDVIGETAYIAWSLAGTRGSDTFVVRGGKIVYQTVAVC